MSVLYMILSILSIALRFLPIFFINYSTFKIFSSENIINIFYPILLPIAGPFPDAPQDLGGFHPKTTHGAPARKRSGNPTQSLPGPARHWLQNV